MKLLNFIKGNKLVSIIILFILFLFGYETYNFYLENKGAFDTSSYFEVTKGSGAVKFKDSENPKTLKFGAEKIKLSEGDTVYTIGKNSMGVISWGDGSLTRIDGNSKILINKSEVSKNLSKINIDFTLVNGKSWSNVVSFLGKDSYFNEKFDTYIAGVRGTTFEVNLDNKYVYVDDHEVDVTDEKSGKNYKIMAGETFSIDLLSKAYEQVRDVVWQQLNENLDKEQIKTMYDNTMSFINNSKDLPKRIGDFFSESWKFMDKVNNGTLTQKDLDNLPQDIKTKVYDEVVGRLQKLYFVKPDNTELFEEKMRMKEILVNLDNGDTESLVRGSMYDLNYAVQNKFKDAENYIKDFLSNGKLDAQALGDVMKNNLDLFKNFPDLKAIFGQNFETIKNIVGVDKIEQNVQGVVNAIEGVKGAAEGAVDKIKDLTKEKQDAINSALNDIFNK